MITCTKDLDGNLHFSDDRALLPSRAILDSLMHFQLWIQRTFLHARRDFVMRRQWWQLRLRRDEPLPLPPYRVSDWYRIFMAAETLPDATVHLEILGPEIDPDTGDVIGPSPVPGSPPVTLVSDNPFEPAESALQRNLRIARLIRDNVDNKHR